MAEDTGTRKGLFARLRDGLSKTRANIVGGMNRAFSGHEEIDEDFFDELEETMIMADCGVATTDRILERLRGQVKEDHITKPSACRELLIRDIRDEIPVDWRAYDFEEGPSVVLVIGVNGVGKTTTVGKLADIYRTRGKKVLIAAADTFRAAAYDQLKVWAERADVPMISGAEGADPASVVFDALNAMKARHADILLIDTAGRLQNKKNLMAELGKIDRIITREMPDVKRENLVVLDAATGQNALSQAREFSQVTHLTGIILTKMDGSSKGGIVVAVQSELGVPVKYIGVGEQIDDLQRFDRDDFVRALFGGTGEENRGDGAAEPDAGAGRQSGTESAGGERTGTEYAGGDKTGAEGSSRNKTGTDDAAGDKTGTEGPAGSSGNSAGEKDSEEEDPWAFFAARQNEVNNR